MRLDRKRFRRLRNAAQSYAAGDHSGAHAAIREAKILKMQAELAHTQAAKQIQAANNMGKDRWELDLHGLHLREANAALDSRYDSPHVRLAHQSVLLPPPLLLYFIQGH